VIDRGKLLVVLCCCLLLLQLRVHRRNALLARCGNFSRQSLASNASGPVIAGAVIGDVNGGIVDDDCIRHRAVVNLDVADAHVVDGTVIVEAISIPVPALIASADVAESIVNAAVVADMPAPEPVVVAVSAAGRSPVTRRPQ